MEPLLSLGFSTLATNAKHPYRDTVTCNARYESNCGIHNVFVLKRCEWAFVLTIGWWARLVGWPCRRSANRKRPAGQCEQWKRLTSTLFAVGTSAPRLDVSVCTVVLVVGIKSRFLRFAGVSIRDQFGRPCANPNDVLRTAPHILPAHVWNVTTLLPPRQASSATGLVSDSTW